MTWLDALLLFCVLLGITAGGFMVARSPTFWVGMALVIFDRLKPLILKRMTPEKEREWRDCERRGGKWNHFRQRCE